MEGIGLEYRTLTVCVHRVEQRSCSNESGEKSDFSPVEEEEDDDDEEKIAPRKKMRVFSDSSDDENHLSPPEKRKIIARSGNKTSSFPSLQNFVVQELIISDTETLDPSSSQRCEMSDDSTKCFPHERSFIPAQEYKDNVTTLKLIIESTKKTLEERQSDIERLEKQLAVERGNCSTAQLEVCKLAKNLENVKEENIKQVAVAKAEFEKLTKEAVEINKTREENAKALSEKLLENANDTIKKLEEEISTQALQIAVKNTEIKGLNERIAWVDKLFSTSNSPVYNAYFGSASEHQLEKVPQSKKNKGNEDFVRKSIIFFKPLSKKWAMSKDSERIRVVLTNHIGKTDGIIVYAKSVKAYFSTYSNALSAYKSLKEETIVNIDGNKLQAQEPWPMYTEGVNKNLLF